MQKRTTEIEKKISELEGIKVFFEDLANEKRDKFDNRSEKWQESEKGEEESEDIDTIEEIAQELESQMEKIIELFPDES